jgi:hypothetical protein
VADTSDYANLARLLAGQDPRTAFRNPALELGERYGLLPLPPLTERKPSAEVRNLAPPPGPPRVQQEVAETISPTMGAYSMGQAAGTTWAKAREGDYAGAAESAAPLGLAVLPIPGAKRLPAPEPRISNPIRAYHGSPHDFDKFDLAKIGTGEGAQAYGHGLYFAENEGVARSYRDALSDDWRVAGKPYEAGIALHQASKLLSEEGSRAAALAKLQRSHRDWFDDAGKLNPRLTNDPHAQTMADTQRILQSNSDIPQFESGRMYEVALHATPESFLDWDKPLAGNHPGTASVLERIYAESAKRSGYKVPLDRSAPTEAHYTSLLNSEMQANPDTFGPTLRDQLASKLATEGIPGVRYLDQRSRGMRVGPSSPANDVARQWLERAGGDQKQAIGLLEGHLRSSNQDIASNQVMQALRDMRPHTSNYVVWSPEIIEILRKYGIVAPAAGASMADILSQPSPTEGSYDGLAKLLAGKR